MRFAELDAVTLDAHGTLVELADPVPELDRSLRKHRIERDGREIARAFATEVGYYREHAHEGRDAETLAQLRLECTRVFLGALGVELVPEEFVDSFVGSIRFEALPGTRAALRGLAPARARARGRLQLGCGPARPPGPDRARRLDGRDVGRGRRSEA